MREWAKHMSVFLTRKDEIKPHMYEPFVLYPSLVLASVPNSGYMLSPVEAGPEKTPFFWTKFAGSYCGRPYHETLAVTPRTLLSSLRIVMLPSGLRYRSWRYVAYACHSPPAAVSSVSSLRLDGYLNGCLL